ncbi:MAG: hypothetical protein Q7V15_08265 [Phenylobacterium sp.]|uniref:hypothetical protein n=1 Tax=Phenylobacterium sp. TaxID=1871053 RepID=UPI0027275803|nr:hypothetical protein [Phenylobacterium sp.]MDO8901332.1 hypothetical protein [Phenylobacterium sp.]
MAAARNTTRRRTGPAAPLVDMAARPEAPGADLIAAVLTHADLEARLSPRRVRRSLSPYRAAELREAGRLNAVEAARSLDLAVIWDEAEAEVVRVIDDAPLRRKIEAGPAWWEDAWDEEVWQASPPAPAPRPALRAVKGGRR